MNELTKPHATVFLPPEIAAPYENLRKTWDWAMFGQIAAHITLVYPQEAPSAELLAERLSEISAQTAPFRLRLGGLAYFESPEKGVYVEVADVDGGLSEMRRKLLASPFAPFPEYVPHVTIIHPRTSESGREFWETAQPQPAEIEFWARETTITAFDRVRWQTIGKFSLKRNK